MLLQRALLQEGATKYIFQNLELHILKSTISHCSLYMQHVKEIDGIRTIYTNKGHHSCFFSKSYDKGVCLLTYFFMCSYLLFLFTWHASVLIYSRKRMLFEGTIEPFESASTLQLMLTRESQKSWRLSGPRKNRLYVVACSSMASLLFSYGPVICGFEVKHVIFYCCTSKPNVAENHAILYCCTW